MKTKHYNNPITNPRQPNQKISNTLQPKRILQVPKHQKKNKKSLPKNVKITQIKNIVQTKKTNIPNQLGEAAEEACSMSFLSLRSIATSHMSFPMCFG